MILCPVNFVAHELCQMVLITMIFLLQIALCNEQSPRSEVFNKKHLCTGTRTDEFVVD